MKIELPPIVLATIEREAEAGYPAEICGFLIGSRSEAVDRVSEAFSARNTRSTETRNRYRIDPDVYREAERRAEAMGSDLVGIYHSHPDAPATPSAYDLAHSWPWVTYLIVSVEKGRTTTATAWRLTDDRAGFDRVEVVSEPVMTRGSSR